MFSQEEVIKRSYKYCGRTWSLRRRMRKGLLRGWLLFGGCVHLVFVDENNLFHCLQFILHVR